jgi:hypothetical protein
VTSEVFRDPAIGPPLLSRLGDHSQGTVLASLAASDGPFWDALVAYCRTRPYDRCANTLVWVFRDSDAEPSPRRLDAAWIDVLATDGWADVTDGRIDPIVRAAARSGDPRFLALVRDRTFDGRWTGLGERLIGRLRQYAGPGRLAFAREALGQSNYDDQHTIVWVLAEDPDPKGRTTVSDLARSRTDAKARLAIAYLAETRATAELTALFAAEAQAATLAPAAYRDALVEAAYALNLREAFPFLLREFREGDSDDAKNAMDRIREHHERLALYESWTSGVESGKRDLAALLKDGDPEIRRAAALSLAAMGDTDSLPTLVRFAKDEKDPRVRAAVLEAVERLSKEPKRAPPAEKVPEGQ